MSHRIAAPTLQEESLELAALAEHAVAGRALAVREHEASAAGRAGVGGVGRRREARSGQNGANREEVLVVWGGGGVEERGGGGGGGGGSGGERGEHAMPVEILG